MHQGKHGSQQGQGQQTATVALLMKYVSSTPGATPYVSELTHAYGSSGRVYLNPSPQFSLRAGLWFNKNLKDVDDSKP